MQDENNAVVGAQPRDITVKNRLLGRGAYVLVLSEANELLVSKRTTSKVTSAAGGPAWAGVGSLPECAETTTQLALRAPCTPLNVALQDVYPGHLDVVVAGIVRAGEEYHETAAR